VTDLGKYHIWTCTRVWKLQ